MLSNCFKVWLLPLPHVVAVEGDDGAGEGYDGEESENPGGQCGRGQSLSDGGSAEVEFRQPGQEFLGRDFQVVPQGGDNVTEIGVDKAECLLDKAALAIGNGAGEIRDV